MNLSSKGWVADVIVRRRDPSILRCSLQELHLRLLEAPLLVLLGPLAAVLHQRQLLLFDAAACELPRQILRTHWWATGVAINDGCPLYKHEASLALQLWLLARLRELLVLAKQLVPLLDLLRVALLVNVRLRYFVKPIPFDFEHGGFNEAPAAPEGLGNGRQIKVRMTFSGGIGGAVVHIHDGVPDVVRGLVLRHVLGAAVHSKGS